MKVAIINDKVKKITADSGKMLIDGINDYEVPMTEIYTSIDDDSWQEVDFVAINNEEHNLLNGII